MKSAIEEGVTDSRTIALICKHYQRLCNTDTNSLNDAESLAFLTGFAEASDSFGQRDIYNEINFIKRLSFHAWQLNDTEKYP